MHHFQSLTYFIILLDLQTKLAKANVYKIDDNVNDLSSALDKQAASISGNKFTIQFYIT